VLAAEHSVAVLRDQAPQPVAERAWFAQRVKVVVRLQEGFLGDILRQLTIADSGEGGRISKVLVTLNEPLKGFSVTALSCDYDVDEVLHASYFRK
jgi:hypothetical protein